MHKILVVDDDINILNMMKNFLTDLVGVEYVLTDSPFEALKIFQTESIDMLITDVAMPPARKPQIFASTRITLASISEATTFNRLRSS